MKAEAFQDLDKNYDPTLDEIKTPDTPELVLEVRPLRDHVVLEPEEMPNKIGEIFIPGTDSIRNKTGGFARVLRVGRGAEHVKVGQRVHLSAYGHHWAGIEFRENGKLRVLIRERDLNGFVEDEG